METEIKKNDSSSILLVIFIGILFILALIRIAILQDMGYGWNENLAPSDFPQAYASYTYLWYILAIIQTVSWFLPAFAIKKKALKITGLIFVILMIILNLWYILR